MRSLHPTVPFADYEEADYAQMMDWIVQYESLQAWKLGHWLVENLYPKDVVDIGCGPGIYLAPFAVFGKEVFGMDACPGAGECIPTHCFERVDLRFPVDETLVDHFDLALCMEVAEHLEEKWADGLVATITAFSDVVLFTAAVPGQGGTNHYNEQPHEYWLAKFAAKGYRIHELQAALRAFLQTLPADCTGWLKHNSYLLTR